MLTAVDDLSRDGLQNGWQPVTEMKALGMILSGNSSATKCFANTLRSIWGAYYANMRHSAVTSSNLDIEQRLLRRAVQPIFGYRCPRWPLSSTLARRLDAVRNVMLAKSMRIAPLPLKTVSPIVEEGSEPQPLTIGTQNGVRSGDVGCSTGAPT